MPVVDVETFPKGFSRSPVLQVGEDVTSDLKEYLVVALEDWYSQLEDIEVHYDEEHEMVDNQAAKENLLREIRAIRFRLERIGDTGSKR